MRLTTKEEEKVEQKRLCQSAKADCEGAHRRASVLTMGMYSDDESDVDLVAPRLDDLPPAALASGDADDEDGDEDGEVGNVLAVKQKAKRTRLRLESKHVCDKRRGLEKLMQMFEGFQAKGAGREEADIERMLRKFEIWVADLVPGMSLSLAEFVGKVNRGAAGIRKADINDEMKKLREAEAARLFGALFGETKHRDAHSDSEDENGQGDESREEDEGKQNTTDSQEAVDNSKETDKDVDVAERIRKNREAALARRREMQTKTAQSHEDLTEEKDNDSEQELDITPALKSNASSVELSKQLVPTSEERSEIAEKTREATENKVGELKDSEVQGNSAGSPRREHEKQNDSGDENNDDDDGEEDEAGADAINTQHQKRRKVLIDDDDDY